MKSRLQRSFLAIAAIVMAWTIGLSGSATVAGAPLPDPSPPGSSDLQPASQIATVNSPNGAAAYVGGNDQNKSFQLPLLRTDVYSGSINFDSYIHVSNSTSGSTNLTFTFFNSDGSTNSTRNVPVPSTISAWQTVDVDLAQVLGTEFKGSGVVTSSPSAVAVSVTFTNGSPNIDNLDAYAGIPSGATSAYFPLAINYGYYTTHF